MLHAQVIAGGDMCSSWISVNSRGRVAHRSGYLMTRSDGVQAAPASIFKEYTSAGEDVRRPAGCTCHGLAGRVSVTADFLLHQASKELENLQLLHAYDGTASAHLRPPCMTVNTHRRRVFLRASAALLYYCSGRRHVKPVPRAHRRIPRTPSLTMASASRP